MVEDVVYYGEAGGFITCYVKLLLAGYIHRRVRAGLSMKAGEPDRLRQKEPFSRVIAWDIY